MLNKNIRRCAHIKTNGTQCGSPAARGHELCHFHWRAAKDFPRRRSTQPIPEPVIDLALIDSPDAIHYALMQIVQGINNDTLSEKKSGRILWALQVMSSNFKQTSFHRQLEDEYSSSNLNCYQIWDKIKQETEDQQRAELHEKRIEEIKRLQKTCCKCHQLVEGESQLTTTAQPATTPAPSTTNSATPNFAIITVQPNSTAATESQPSSTTQDQLLPTIKASADTQPSVLPITKSSSHQVNKSSATSVPFASFASFALKSANGPMARLLNGPILQSHTEPNSFKSSVIRKQGGEGGTINGKNGGAYSAPHRSDRGDIVQIRIGRCTSGCHKNQKSRTSRSWREMA